MTASQVEENLLERDLVMYLKYAERRLLPARRAQLQLARIAQYVHGDSTKRLSYYVIGADETPDVMEDESPEEVGSVFAAVSGGNVVMLKGRKKKAV